MNTIYAQDESRSIVSSIGAPQFDIEKIKSDVNFSLSPPSPIL